MARRVVWGWRPMRTEYLGGLRVRTQPCIPDRRYAGRGRPLPRAACPRCGSTITREWLKWLLIQQIVGNPLLSPRRRVQIVRDLFPGDTSVAGLRAAKPRHRTPA